MIFLEVDDFERDVNWSSLLFSSGLKFLRRSGYVFLIC